MLTKLDSSLHISWKILRTLFKQGDSLDAMCSRNHVIRCDEGPSTQLIIEVDERLPRDLLRFSAVDLRRGEAGVAFAGYTPAPAPTLVHQKRVERREIYEGKQTKNKADVK